MLIPGEYLREELATVPEFARFIPIEEADQIRPALVVKTSSLTLKALLRDGVLRLVLGELRGSGPGIYGVEIDEGDVVPAFAWSIVTSAAEQQVIKRFITAQECDLHLFNELGVNVASAPHVRFSVVGELGDGFGPESDETRRDEDVEAWLAEVESATDVVATLERAITWDEVKAAYYSDAGQVVRLHALTDDEGTFQENLVLWMSEYLQVNPIRGPQLVRQRKRREFTDVLFSNAQTPFLIESKSLSVLGEPVCRAQMRKRILKSTDTAISQLAGACGKLRGGAIIEDHNGNALEIPRDGMPHAIVLIPDMELLGDARNYPEIYAHFTTTEKAILQILDMNELISLVKDACYVAARARSAERIDVFDHFLTERYKAVLAQGDARVRFRVRFSEG